MLNAGILIKTCEKDFKLTAIEYNIKSLEITKKKNGINYILSVILTIDTITTRMVFIYFFNETNYISYQLSKIKAKIHSISSININDMPLIGKYFVKILVEGIGFLFIPDKYNNITKNNYFHPQLTIINTNFFPNSFKLTVKVEKKKINNELKLKVNNISAKFDSKNLGLYNFITPNLMTFENYKIIKPIGLDISHHSLIHTIKEKDKITFKVIDNDILIAFEQLGILPNSSFIIKEKLSNGIIEGSVNGIHFEKLFDVFQLESGRYNYFYNKQGFFNKGFSYIRYRVINNVFKMIVY